MGYAVGVSSTTKSSEQLLDEVVRITQVENFDGERYLDQLRTEVTLSDEAGADSRDARIRAALAAVDRFACRLMRIKLDHLLDADTSVPPRFRTYLATRVLDYIGDLDGLRARVAQVATGVDRAGAIDTAEAVAGAADNVMATHARIREGVLALVPVEPAEEAEPEPNPPSASFFELIELD